MTREDIKEEVLALKGLNWLLELATGTGKSKIALDKIRSLAGRKKSLSLLIVVPRTVHKQNWKEEIDKWWPDNNLTISFTTYVSFPKYTGSYNFAIFDECHHLSERCREALGDFEIGHSILLSATVGKQMKKALMAAFDNSLVCYKKGLRNVIDEGILPDPKVYLIPLSLENGFPTEIIMRNKNAKGRTIECCYKERWKYFRQKKYPVRVSCTEKQYYEDLSSQIGYWKRRYMSSRNDIAKNKWLRVCNDRLRWLSDKKVQYVGTLLHKFRKYRTLTFCNSIDQTEVLGKYCINSKNKDSAKNLELFNSGGIDHITACNILNEGMNLVNCQIGIYTNLNSSETIVKQRTGRLLRHPNPVIIIPFYKNTREEELVEKMLEDYNRSLVKTVQYISEIDI